MSFFYKGLKISTLFFFLTTVVYWGVTIATDDSPVNSTFGSSTNNVVLTFIDFEPKMLKLNQTINEKEKKLDQLQKEKEILYLNFQNEKDLLYSNFQKEKQTLNSTFQKEMNQKLEEQKQKLESNASVELEELRKECRKNSNIIQTSVDHSMPSLLSSENDINIAAELYRKRQEIREVKYIYSSYTKYRSTGLPCIVMGLRVPKEFISETNLRSYILKKSSTDTNLFYVIKIFQNFIYHGHGDKVATTSIEPPVFCSWRTTAGVLSSLINSC